jgi:hypothetical protein
VYRDIFHGRNVSADAAGTIGAAEALAYFPVAVLVP